MKVPGALPCYIGGEELQRVIDEVLAAPTPKDGEANRYATEGGMNVQTTAEVTAPPPGVCGCGRPSSHQGRCTWRRREVSAGRYISFEMKRRLGAKKSSPVQAVPKIVKDAFAESLTALRPSLYRQARNLTRGNAEDAMDLVSQAVLQALEKRDQFKPGSNLGGWAYTIMRNIFITEKRSYTRRPQVSLMVEGKDGYEVERVDPALTVPPMQESGLIASDMKRKFDTLGQDQRTTLLLAVNDVSYDEIAERTGVSVGTVKSRISRGRATLNDASRETPPPYAKERNMYRHSMEHVGGQTGALSVSGRDHTGDRSPFPGTQAPPVTPSPSPQPHSVDAMIDKLEEHRAKIDAAISALKSVRDIIPA